MRSGLTLAGVLVALAVVALLVKQQLTTPHIAGPQATQAGTVQEQSQQIQQQVQQQLDEAMQQRPKPEDFE